MNGTVTRLRPRGVEATMDADTSALTDIDKFQVYRVVNAVETIVGTYYAKRSKGTNLICLNPDINSEGAVALVGDLVRSV